MTGKDIAKFLEANIEPLDDAIYGPRYRASAQLVDGTDLPCVVFQSKRRLVDLALRRFTELRIELNQYRDVVGSFAASGGTVDVYNLKRVNTSPYAWPVSMLKTIHGETTMGWTAFVVEMKDSRCFSYGTPFSFEFLDLPNGYSFLDIKCIYSGAVYAKDEGLQPFSISRAQGISCLRERPFFTCYLEEIE
jgi:hypothetical protein